MRAAGERSRKREDLLRATEKDLDAIVEAAQGGPAPALARA
jgi:hypothetical protein